MRTDIALKTECKKARLELRKEEAQAVQNERARMGLIRRIYRKKQAGPDDVIHRHDSELYVALRNEEVQDLASRSRYFPRISAIPPAPEEPSITRTENFAIGLFHTDFLLDLSTLYVIRPLPYFNML